MKFSYTIEFLEERKKLVIRRDVDKEAIVIDLNQNIDTFAKIALNDDLINRLSIISYWFSPFL